MKNKILIALIGLITIILLGGLTYAYFTANGVENNVNTNNIQTSTVRYGNLIVSYHNSNGTINAGIVDLKQSQSGQDKLYLMKFTIQNTANIKRPITINWSDLTNDFCQYQNGGVCTNNSSHTFVGNELSYNLYECASDGYSDSVVGDIKPTCTSIGTTSIPVTGNTTKLQTNDKITLEPASMNYYMVLITIKNITSEQNYQ